jgi:hypothetical protein
MCEDPKLTNKTQLNDKSLTQWPQGEALAAKPHGKKTVFPIASKWRPG